MCHVDVFDELVLGDALLAAVLTLVLPGLVVMLSNVLIIIPGFK